MYSSSSRMSIYLYKAIDCYFDFPHEIVERVSEIREAPRS